MSTYVVARRMHHLSLGVGERTPTWYLANVSPEVLTDRLDGARRFSADAALKPMEQLP